MTVSPTTPQGEMKRRLARILGTDPDRYADEIGVERHRNLTAGEIGMLTDELGIGFIDGSKQEQMDAIMIKLGRDHRTGAPYWDSSDLRAVLEEVQDGGS